MLKGIDPLLTGDLLKVLDDMGHSDHIVIADVNFPAHRTHSVVIEVPGIDVVRMTRAVCSVLTLDEDHPPALMESTRTPRPVVQDELLGAAGVTDCTMVDRWSYYDLTRDAVAVISTGELRLWANITLYKGLPYSALHYGSCGPVGLAL